MTPTEKIGAREFIWDGKPVYFANIMVHHYQDTTEPDLYPQNFTAFVPKSHADKLEAENYDLKNVELKLKAAIRERDEARTVSARYQDERDKLKQELDALIKITEPSEETYESLVGEIKYLKDVELQVGTLALSESKLRIENAKLLALVEKLDIHFSKYRQLMQGDYASIKKEAGLTEK